MAGGDDFLRRIGDALPETFVIEFPAERVAGRRPRKSGVKCRGSTPELRPILRGLSQRGAAGIPGVGVKSVDIWKNTDGEGRLRADD